MTPILFVVLHLYLLLNLKLLADQVKGLNRLIREGAIDPALEERVRLQFPNFLIVQVLGATKTERNSFTGRMIELTAWLTLVLAPLLLLLFFLTCHGTFIQ